MRQELRVIEKDGLHHFAYEDTKGSVTFKDLELYKIFCDCAMTVVRGDQEMTGNIRGLGNITVVVGAVNSAFKNRLSTYSSGHVGLLRSSDLALGDKIVFEREPLAPADDTLDASFSQLAELERTLQAITAELQPSGHQ